MLRLATRGLCTGLPGGSTPGGTGLPGGSLSEQLMFPIQKIGRHGPLCPRDILKMALA
jgi:hypothetical protein